MKRLTAGGPMATTAQSSTRPPHPFLPSQPPTTIRYPLQSLPPPPISIPQIPSSKSLQIRHCLVHSGHASTGGSSTSGLSLLFQHFGIDSQELEALLQKHPQLGTAHTEPLRLRLHYLRSVGITGPALCSTVLKRPDVLTSENISPFLDFIRDELHDLEPSKLARFLVAADLKNLTRFPENVRLLLAHGLPRDDLGHFINSINIKKVLSDRSVDELDEFLNYLKGWEGFHWMLRRPQLLNLDLHTQLIPRIEYLTGLSGGDSKATKMLIGKLPFVLAYTVQHYEGHVAFWRSVGVSEEELFKVAAVYPNIFSISKERKLKPRIEFLRQCGLGASDVSRFLIKAPLFLSLSFEANLAKKLCFLVKIGYSPKTRELAAAIGAATRTSCENMQMVVGVFLGYGFSCEDVLAMSKKQPQILQYNYASLEEKVEYLVGEMGREVGELLAFPAFLGYKLDDRIKMRYEAKKRSRGRKMSINKLLSVSAERFYWNEGAEEVGEQGRCLELDDRVES